MRAYKKINERTMEGTTKKDGKVTGSSRIVVAADGKSRTVTTNLTDLAGKKTHNVAFYDQQ
jgi:flavin-dependent dehydrogenase